MDVYIKTGFGKIKYKYTIVGNVIRFTPEPYKIQVFTERNAEHSFKPFSGVIDRTLNVKILSVNLYQYIFAFTLGYPRIQEAAEEMVRIVEGDILRQLHPEQKSK